MQFSFTVPLRKDNKFTDDNLACQNDHQVETQKLILVASSPYSANILKENKHAHPLQCTGEKHRSLHQANTNYQTQYFLYVLLFVRVSCLCCSASLLLLLRSSSSVWLMVPLQPGLQKSFRRSSHAQRKSIFSRTIYSWRMRKFTKICVSVCLCLYVCVCLLVCLSVCLYVCLYVYQFICLNMLPQFF